MEAGGLDVSLNLPNTKIDLGSMPTFSASVNTDASDELHAIVAPIILVAICVPFVLMRAAMMELDCFVTRRKQLGDRFEDLVLTQQHKRSGNARFRREFGTSTLTGTMAQNVESLEMKARLYLTLCCSTLAMLVLTAFMMMLGALLYMNL